MAGNLNLNALRNGLLSPYINAGIAIYKCPSDKIASANGDRVRTVSMNSEMGVGSGVTATPDYNQGGFRRFNKVSDLGNSFPPFKAFVFLDEHPGSINDGYFQVNMNSNVFPDVPGSLHSFGGSFSYADGHAEIHKWRDDARIPVVKNISLQNVPAPNGQDLTWLREHTTIKN